MRTTPLPEFQSEALMPGMSFDLLEARLRRIAASDGLDLHDGHGRSVWIQVRDGEYGAKKRGTGSLVYARAHNPDGLGAMQSRIAQVAGGYALRWTSDQDGGARPVNFSLARVVRSHRIAPAFQRVRLSGPDLARFAEDDSIHFRLVLPQPGDDRPEWPRIGPKGQTVWPLAPRTLHRPVYTVSAADPAAGWLETDVFLHDNGRTTHWALTAQAGSRIGLMGPSGGGIPDAPDLILAGDETAYPAIARITERRGNSAHGRVFLLGKQREYPFARPKGWSFRHLPNGESQLVSILQQIPVSAETAIWIASERQATEPLRELVNRQLATRVQSAHVSGFWTA